MSKIRTCLLVIVCLCSGIGLAHAQGQSLLPDLGVAEPLSLTLQIPNDLNRPKIVPLESAQPVATTPVSIKPLARVNDRVCHRALLFDEQELERLGQCQRWQGLRSAASFMAGVVLYPWEVARGRSGRCQCSPE